MRFDWLLEFYSLLTILPILGVVYTPPQLAEQYGIAVERIRGWILAGQLRALNLSDSESRPRWRITDEDWQEFLDTRANCMKSTLQNPKRKQRRRKSGVTEYF